MNVIVLNISISFVKVSIRNLHLIIIVHVPFMDFIIYASYYNVLRFIVDDKRSEK